MRRRTPKSLALVWHVAALLLPAHAFAAPPTLYSHPALQSPVRGDPDDLLLLPGHGFDKTDRVVYLKVDDSNAQSSTPSLPTESTELGGFATVVNDRNVPHSLTIRLPPVLKRGTVYALRVVNSHGEWSNGITINDPRPLWITPDTLHSSGELESLPRQLKIVGRNLGANSYARVRLSGPESISIAAAHIEQPLSDYEIVAQLPKRMKPGHYAVSISTDGSNWIALDEQRLTVESDLGVEQEFSLDAAEFGGCSGDDDEDDTECLIRAIARAAQAGGGKIRIGAGRWRLKNGRAPGVEPGDGIVLPRHVSLVGIGREASILLRDAEWNTSSTNATFTLEGANTIRGLTFRDLRVYGSRDTHPAPMLQLGRYYERAERSKTSSIDGVVIADNTFDKPYYAIADGGLPIKRLIVTNNEFGAYRLAIALIGNRFNMRNAFTVDDSVIAHNIFRPGSFLDESTAEGAMATAIGASRRLEFSDNVADGASGQFLYGPNDRRGWRAAFFWHLNNNHEQVLVSGNTVTCSGDKDGDGEAIAFDNNANTFGFAEATPATVGTPTTVTVKGHLESKQNQRNVDESRYYRGHWVQIAAGLGVGQARKIVAYQFDPASSTTSFTVSPRWDVAPDSTSKISVGREDWQVYVIGNTVDHRKPLCQKSNGTQRKGGVIGFWSQTADSVIDGNRQYDTDGIIFEQSYQPTHPGCRECPPSTFYQAFLDVRNNLIQGEYDWPSDCSQSGITGAHSASPAPASPPPIASYGVSISHNRIERADGIRGGAIAISPTWYRGPPPERWPLVDSMLIHHNSILDIAGANAFAKCDSPHDRIGIHLASQLVWRTTLYANSCSNVTKRVQDRGIDTVRVCPAGLDSCECGGR